MDDMMLRLKLTFIRVGLLPFDFLLRLIGPNYRLFYWFFLTAPAGLVGWLGRLRAIRAADTAVQKVPAYRTFLEASNVDVASAVMTLDLPPTDKRGYIDIFPPDARCVEGVIP